MYHLKDQLFRSIFDQISDLRIIIKSERNVFPIVLCNSAFLDYLETDELSLVGKPLDLLFEKLQLTNYTRNSLRQQIEISLDTQKSTTSDVFSAMFNKQEQENTYWWKLTVSPVKEEDGVCNYITLGFVGITEKIITRIDREQRAISTSHNTQNEGDLESDHHQSNVLLKELNNQLDKINLELEDKAKIATQLAIAERDKVKMIIDNAPCGIASLYGEQMIIESANGIMLNMWHKTAEVIGMPIIEAIPELIDLGYDKQFLDVFSSGEQQSYQEIIPLLGGENHIKGYYNYFLHPLKNEEDVVTGILILVYEVTHQVESRMAIQLSEYRLKRMINHTPIAMVILRGQDLFVELVNSRMLSVWEKTEVEILEKPLLQIFPELLDQPFPYFFKSILHTGKNVFIDEAALAIKLKDGKYKNIYVTISCDPLKDANGKVEGILLTMQDISERTESRKLIERKNIELLNLQDELIASNEELKVTNEDLDATQINLNKLVEQLTESEGKIRSIVEQAPVGICFLSGPDFTITLVNDVILNIWGRTRDEVIGKPHMIARPEMAESPVKQWIEDVYTTGRSIYNNETKLFLYNGPNKPLREAWINSQYQPLKNNRGEIIGQIVILSEITEFKLNRMKHELAQEKLTLAIESAELGTWSLDLKTMEYTQSIRLRKMFGFSEETSVSLEDIYNQIDTEYISYVKRSVTDAIRDGGIHEVVFPARVFNEDKTRWFKAKGQIFYDDDKIPSLYTGTILDITKEKLEEIRKNDFIAIVSHELKTPLTSLKAYIQLLYSKYEGDRKNALIGSALAKCLNQIQKMSVLIKGFLDIARLENEALYLDIEEFDIAEVVNDSVQDILMLNQTHHIHVCGDASIRLKGDREKIAQVLNNLLSNAIKYSPIGSNIYIDWQEASGNLEVKVSDEGIGIKMHDLSRIFERFYRVENSQTKTIAGFGIGLYLCKEIVLKHNGRIWVECEADRGSEFYFSLPL